MNSRPLWTLVVVLAACGQGPASETARESADNTVTASPEANIVVTSPVAGQSVEMPMVVAGRARVFENSFAWRVRDGDGDVIAEGHGMAASPDVGQFGPFQERVFYPAPDSPEGRVEVFEYSARDGSEINKVIVPVRFSSERVKISIYFTSTRLNPNALPCGKVFPVDREIPRTVAPAEAALRLLLAGPTEVEKRDGYQTSLPPGTELRSVRLVGGMAEADFSETLDEIAGACAVEAARAQVDSTLQQFPAIKAVRILKNGVEEGALEP